MKTKFLLAALSLPLVFTACSQDEWMEEANKPSNIQAEGLKVALNVTKEFEAENQAQTRADWDGDKIVFEKGDKISMYWLGASQTLDRTQTESSEPAAQTEATGDFSEVGARSSLTGKFNSIFRTTDGSKFTSESMVFVGGNIAVFPAKTSFVNEGKVTIKVDADQNSSNVERIPYISNQLYIANQGSNQSEQLPGYYGEDSSLKSLYSPLKMAANVVNLTLNLSNIPAGYNFTVQQVELVTEAAEIASATATRAAAETPTHYPAAFTIESNVTTLAAQAKTDGKVNTVISNGEVTQKKATIIAQTWSKAKDDARKAKLTTTALKDPTSNVVKATFVILPTDATAEQIASAKIVIRTNCGTITIKDGEAEDGTTLTPIVNDADGSKATVKDAFVNFLTSGKSTKTTSTFYNENIGKIKDRSIAVDASSAVLNGSLVYTDDDIKRYVNLYTAMGKSDVMQLVLSKTGSKGTFNGLKKSTLALVDAKNKVSLVANKNQVDGVQIVGGGEVFTVNALVNDPEEGVTVIPATELPLVLSNEAWTMDDVFSLTNEDNEDANPLAGIDNKGTLTIKGTWDEENDVNNHVVAKVANNGTLNLSNEGTKKVIFGTLTTGVNSTINVENGQELQFANNIATQKLFGTINVKSGAYLTIAANVTVVNNGTINNWGTVAAERGEGGLTNAIVPINSTTNSSGTINVKDDMATTYVQDNTEGIINLKSRDNEVVVNTGNEGKIVYNYNYAEDGATFKQYPADKFTLVIFDAAATKLTLHKTDANANDGNGDGTVAPEKTSMTFKGATQLTSKDITIADLTVNSGADLKIASGNKLNVTNLSNNGTITIGGTIVYSGVIDPDAVGRVLSIGNGAINAAQSTEN